MTSTPSYSPPSPERVTASFLSIMDLKEVGPTSFEGSSLPLPGRAVFGGQLMAQALIAMGRTVEATRRPHHLSAQFIEGGDSSRPLELEVSVLRDGGSFSSRRVEIRQGEALVLEAHASFQEVQEGLTHDSRIPMAPDPVSLPTSAQVLGGVDHPIARHFAFERPIDIRHVDPHLYFQPDSRGRAQQMLWMRALSDLAPSACEAPLLHSAALAYASDYTPFEPIIRRQGLTWLTPGLRTATLNHSMWFHAPADLNEWVLYVQESPHAGGGRGLATGSLYSREGHLVATLAQEGMIRLGSTDKESRA